MITVSDSFKKAIKNDTREIHGYVEVKYQDKNFDTEVTKIPTSSPLTSTNGIVQDNKILQKYASLENNYTLLDGSSMVWNENNILDEGYISDSTFENISDNEIIITNNNTDISTKGITIYFKENLPFSFTVTMTNTDNEQIIDTVTNNQSYVYQYIFPTEMYISTVSITINDVEFPKNRIRIASIDFNLGDLYEGEELVSFEVTEELDLLLENVPINNCSIKLNNYPDNHGKSKFDVLNPKGLTSLLTNNVMIKPYCGVLTELNGIEYIPMGVFYLSDWSSDNDGNVSLNAYGILNKMKERQMIVDTDFMFNSLSIHDIGTMIENQLDVDTDFPLYSYPWINDDLQNPDLFEYISHVLPNFLYYDSPYDDLEAEFRKFYTDRYGVITLNKIDNNVIDKIEQSFLKKDIDYKTMNDIKDLNVKSVAYGSDNSTNVNIINENYTLNDTEEYIWFTKTDSYVNYSNSFNYNVVSGSGSATMIGYNRFMILVKFTGTVGSVIHITYNANAGTTRSTEKNITMRNNIKDGDSISIDLSNYRYIMNANILKTIYFNLSKKYKISAQIMGDPSLEIGDTINIQTRYQDVDNGYKKIIITKQQFTYNGGLECNLEGVGD